MRTDPVILLAGRIAEMGDLIAILAFVVQYTFLARWWANPIGRTIVWKDVALMGAIGLSLAGSFIRPTPTSAKVMAWVVIATLLAICVIMVWRIVVFWRIHKEGAGLQAEHTVAARQRENERAGG